MKTFSNITQAKFWLDPDELHKRTETNSQGTKNVENVLKRTPTYSKRTVTMYSNEQDMYSNEEET
jgi:hypothetical protein